MIQNRYKAILCDYDAHVLELAAYIHLNPLRAGFVKSFKDLRKYRWCGHGALMGDFRASFLADAEVLEKFGNNVEKARRNYEAFIEERVGKYKKGELSAGGLKRSHGGTGGLSARRGEERELSDARILGDGEFVEAVLNLKGKEQNQSLMSLAQIAGIVWTKTGVGWDEIKSLSRVRKIAKARALYCFLAKEKGGVKGSELTKDLRLTSGAVSHLGSVGRKVIRFRNN